MDACLQPISGYVADSSIQDAVGWKPSYKWNFTELYCKHAKFIEKRIICTDSHTDSITLRHHVEKLLKIYMNSATTAEVVEKRTLRSLITSLYRPGTTFAFQRRIESHKYIC